MTDDDAIANPILVEQEREFAAGLARFRVTIAPLPTQEIVHLSAEALKLIPLTNDDRHQMLLSAEAILRAAADEIRQRRLYELVTSLD